MLQQAKDEGLTINVRHAKILFCGAARAGKTSFCRLLRNEEHEKVYKSTPAANAQQVLISDKVNLVGANWICLDSKLETQQITNRLILKLQSKKSTTKVTSSVSNNPDTNSDDDVSSHEYPMQTDAKTTDVSDSTDAPNLELKGDISQSLEQPLLLEAVSQLTDLFEDEDESSNYNESTNKQISIEEKMLAYTDNVNVPVAELESIPETWDLFTLLDTGGQPEFINMLPAINSSTAITFVVLNMSDGKACLNSLVTAQYECEGYNYSNHDAKYTNMHLLKCLLSSIKVSAIKKDYFQPEIVKQVAEDEHPKPVVCIIGTCFDVLQSKFGQKYVDEVFEINEEVRKLIEIIENKDVLLFWCRIHNRKKHYVIPVDNTIPRELQTEDNKPETAKTIQRIREHCNDILKKKAQYEIPISWFILELELRNNAKVCIPLSEVEEICNGIMPSHRKMNILEIREVLKFYHSYGMLLYFSEVDGMNQYVITNPQWLFLNLTKIIMCKFANDDSDLYCSHLIEGMDKGICSMDLLRTLKLDLSGVQLSSFINLLMYLKVIAPMKTIKNAYFIPNVLPPFDEKCIFTEREFGTPAAFSLEGKCIHPEVQPLLIEFTFGMIPRGLFGSLIVQLLQDNADTYELCENDRMLCQYADLICFFIKPCYHVFLHDKICFLELQVRVIGKEPSCHCKVQTTVTEALKKVCNEFNWRFRDCRYGFLCDKHKETEHLSLLDTNPPYTNEIPIYTRCDNRQLTYLNKAHTVWFEVC